MKNEFIKYDLHIHSSFSDGTCSPAEIIMIAKKRELNGISITDHDNIVTEDIDSIAEENDILYIHGIEFSTLLHNVHILGYGIDQKNVDFLNFIKMERKKREMAAMEMCEKSREFGVEVAFEEVLQEKARIDGAIGRPHIATVMVRKGYVRNVYEAFSKWLRKGCPVFVEYKKYHHLEVIEKIKKWGGLSVLAHPGMVNYSFKKRVLDECLEAGINGLEVYYPRHQQKDIGKLLEVCYKHHLVITGGSDFHGSSKPDIQVGSAGINENNFEKFVSELNKVTGRYTRIAS